MRAGTGRAAAVAAAYELRPDSFDPGIGTVTVEAGKFDRLDFDRGGVKVAEIPPGVYTPDTLEAAIVAALEAADATPAWTCDVGVGESELSFIGSNMAFTLLFGSGANVARSVGLLLGYLPVDTVSFTGHEADHPSFDPVFAEFIWQRPAPPDGEPDDTADTWATELP